MGLHTHEFVLPTGEVIPLSAAAGSAHVHTGSHEVLGGDFSTSQFDDTADHIHMVVTTEQNFPTGMPVPTPQEMGIKSQGEAVERNRSSRDYPEVLKWSSVRESSLPELGFSGMPASLESGIPASMRFWKAETIEDALLVRRALVESGIVSPENVRPVTFKRVGGTSEPELMRVRRDDSGLVPVIDLPDGPLEIPSFDSDIELAIKLAGLDSSAVSIDQGSLAIMQKFGGRTGAEIVDSLMDSPGEWVIEISAEDVSKIISDADLPTAWMLPHSDASVFLSSTVPTAMGVRFFTDAPEGIRGALGRSQTLTGDEIMDRLTKADAGPVLKRFSEEAARLAGLEEWSDDDFRIATRIKSLIDGELRKEPVEQRAPFLKALGLDRESAGQAVFKRTDYINIRKFLDEDSAGDRRLVYGVVLEPDTVDLQNDIMSREDIEEAFYRYVEYYSHRGVQHLTINDDDMRITQKFLAPCDFVPDGCDESELIRGGSWVMEYRILDDGLWKDVKRGAFTGFSIGGYGKRIPLS